MANITCFDTRIYIYIKASIRFIVEEGPQSVYTHLNSITSLGRTDYTPPTVANPVHIDHIFLKAK